MVTVAVTVTVTEHDPARAPRSDFKREKHSKTLKSPKMILRFKTVSERRLLSLGTNTFKKTINWIQKC